MKEQSDSKKLIPIYLQKIFLEKTDKTHFIRMPEILAELEKKGVTPTFLCLKQLIFTLKVCRRRAITNTICLKETLTLMN